MDANLNSTALLKNGQIIKFNINNLRPFKRNIYVMDIGNKSVLLCHKKDGTFVEASILHD